MQSHQFSSPQVVYLGLPHSAQPPARALPDAEAGVAFDRSGALPGLPIGGEGSPRIRAQADAARRRIR
jgi:hypothetical protein